MSGGDRQPLGRTANTRPRNGRYGDNQRAVGIFSGSLMELEGVSGLCPAVRRAFWCWVRCLPWSQPQRNCHHQVFHCFVILLVLVAYWFKGTNFDRRYRRLLAAVPESWFGEVGVCFSKWTTRPNFAKVPAQGHRPNGLPCPTFSIFESLNGSSSNQITDRVAIPHGRISDLPGAEELVTIALTASVRLSSTVVARLRGGCLDREAWRITRG